MGRYTKEIAHKIMSSVKSKDTKPELLLRKALWSQGLRYRKNYGGLKGRPDVVFIRAKIAIFCDGDFWHGHNWVLRGLGSLEEELSRYSDYWKEKILRNIERDKQVTETLSNEGWLVIRLWESDIERDITGCVSTIVTAYQQRCTK